MSLLTLRFAFTSPVGMIRPSDCFPSFNAGISECRHQHIETSMAHYVLLLVDDVVVRLRHAVT